MTNYDISMRILARISKEFKSQISTPTHVSIFVISVVKEMLISVSLLSKHSSDHRVLFCHDPCHTFTKL